LATSCPPRRALHRSFLSLADILPAVSLAASLVSLADVLPAAPLDAPLVSFCCRRLARRSARCIACFFLSSTFCPPRCSVHRSFLSLVDVLPAAPLAASLVFFQFSTFCPPRCLLHRSFLSLVDVLPAAPLAVWLVSPNGQRVSRCVSRFFLLLTSCALCHSLHRSFLSLVDVSMIWCSIGFSIGKLFW
jgi:hypothetical protein